MGEPHPAEVKPSRYGDSVGHYEGDTLVIDTVGIKIGPFSMVDMFGTPHSSALHVVERYSLIEYEAAVEVQERTLKTRPAFPETPVAGGDADYRISIARPKVPGGRGRQRTLRRISYHRGVARKEPTVTAHMAMYARLEPRPASMGISA